MSSSSRDPARLASKQSTALCWQRNVRSLKCVCIHYLNVIHASELSDVCSDYFAHKFKVPCGTSSISGRLLPCP